MKGTVNMLLRADEQAREETGDIDAMYKGEYRARSGGMDWRMLSSKHCKRFGSSG